VDANSLKKRVLANILCVFALPTLLHLATAAEIDSDPSNYRQRLTSLKPGDTINLAPGRYPRLTVSHLNGRPDAWITIRGPASGSPAVIAGESGYNTVEIINSSYVAIENLRIDSRGIVGAFGISAKDGARNRTHDIRIEGNILVGQGTDQQNLGISTKTPTWGWIIRSNQILGAGTGIYLGDSDGTQPFVNGLIENNLIEDTIGYNMEIKDQISIPEVPGMPTESTSTIIRNNVFIKDDQPSPDGDRPNVLVGAFPSSGTGSHNLYEIYGNFFFHNHREALFQGSGRVSLHDNIFVDGPPGYAAVVLRRHNFPLRVAYVYNNTVYTSAQGIHFGTPALDADAVVGNLVFGSDPISGSILRSSDNVVGPLASARTYVNSPSFELGAMDFYPRAGQCQGKAMDLRPFKTQTDYNRDFNGTLKTQAKGAVLFRGAYAGAGTNPGWRLQEAIKPSGQTPLKPVAPTQTEPSPRQSEPDSHSQLFILGRQRCDELEVASRTIRTSTFPTSRANCRPGDRVDDYLSRHVRSYAPGLLLWKSAARTQSAQAERCDCSSIARASG
jgi:hypothetical protein